LKQKNEWLKQFSVKCTKLEVKVHELTSERNRLQDKVDEHTAKQYMNLSEKIRTGKCRSPQAKSKKGGFGRNLFQCLFTK